MDPFLSPEQAQTVWFATPLVATVLRIYLLDRMDASAFNCLRLEVIGCEVPGMSLSVIKVCKIGIQKKKFDLHCVP